MTTPDRIECTAGTRLLPNEINRVYSVQVMYKAYEIAVRNC